MAIDLAIEDNNGVDFQHSEAYIYAISPSAKVEESENGATIVIKDKDGETVAVLHNGKDGRDGTDGAQGPKGDTGERGPQGETGPQGPPGSDADIIRFLPTDTASGAVASFPDGADDIPLESLVVGINPVQSGEDDPSPTNVRPITGWTGMTVNANGTEIPISWESEAGTVYGGKLDVLTGVLTVDKAVITATEFYSYASGDLTYGRVVLPNALPTTSVATDYVTSKFPVDRSAAENTTRRVSGYAYFYFPTGTTREDAESVVNGTQIVYPVADPVTYQLTPHEVKSLLGQNNIWADTGDTSVTYRADIQRYIQKMVSQ